jgi:hypothetical protein
VISPSGEVSTIARKSASRSSSGEACAEGGTGAGEGALGSAVGGALTGGSTGMALDTLGAGCGSVETRALIEVKDDAGAIGENRTSEAPARAWRKSR